MLGGECVNCKSITTIYKCKICKDCWIKIKQIIDFSSEKGDIKYF